jgi:pimeloyl-ACP methyl ester carboxylesterase
VRRWLFALASLLLACLPAWAVPHEARVPLRDGRIRVADLSDRLLAEMHCPPKLRVSIPGEIDVRGFDGARFVEALNHALGDGCRISVCGDELLLHVDREKLPTDWDATKVAVRVFTAYAAPENTAAQQRRYGLFLPPNFDESRAVTGGRIVILIHGLDSGPDIWGCLGPRLECEGYQVAYFNYPAAQGIADSAELFAQHVAALRQTFPGLKVDVVAHSMGSLVARAYVEGPHYADGDIDHLLLLAPPNHGSSWAGAEWALKLTRHCDLCMHDPDWHWTWIITDGLGEAARDLKPKSEFLKQLNYRPRRAGVKYTIIAGNQGPGWRLAAGAVAAPADWVPDRAADWWGIRHTRHGLQHCSDSLRSHTGKSDGPVKVKSARLDGVTDFVLLPADHAAMYCAVAGKPPAAWDTIRDRLAR